jgi:hypothetical protein
MPMDPRLLAGPPAGAMQGQVPPEQTPAQPQMPQGQRPSLTAITMTGLDGRQGSENIVFKFADGFQATETFAELAHMGLDQKIIGAVGQVFEHAGDIVYSTNRGGGGGA